MSLAHGVITALHRYPLEVPLKVPFVIATATMNTTLAWRVELTLQVSSPAGPLRFTGQGEVATLPPVTSTLAALEGAWESSTRALVGRQLELTPSALSDWQLAEHAPELRAAVETAYLDALGQACGQSIASLLNGEGQGRLVHQTDITLPIGAPDYVASLATTYLNEGFSIFKLKVGKSVDEDLRVLRALPRWTEDGIAVRLRIDANGGFSSRDAIHLVNTTRAEGIALECFEQPCARTDKRGMAEVTEAVDVPIVADESLHSMGDLEDILEHRLASGVNLKLVKVGGPLEAFAIGQAAKTAGLKVMAGAMVETKLGITAMLSVVEALGGVDYVDLDTAFLLEGDPFDGGYEANKDLLLLSTAAGLGLSYTR